jgi:hypothetical protein
MSDLEIVPENLGDFSGSVESKYKLYPSPDLYVAITLTHFLNGTAWVENQSLIPGIFVRILIVLSSLIDNE